MHFDFSHDQAELTLTIPHTGTIGRILGYVNHARMGDYAEALAIGASLRQPLTLPVTIGRGAIPDRVIW